MKIYELMSFLIFDPNNFDYLFIPLILKPQLIQQISYITLKIETGNKTKMPYSNI